MWRTKPHHTFCCHKRFITIHSLDPKPNAFKYDSMKLVVALEHRLICFPHNDMSNCNYYNHEQNKKSDFSRKKWRYLLILRESSRRFIAFCNLSCQNDTIIRTDWNCVHLICGMCITAHAIANEGWFQQICLVQFFSIRYWDEEKRDERNNREKKKRIKSNWNNSYYYHKQANRTKLSNPIHVHVHNISKLFVCIFEMFMPFRSGARFTPVEFDVSQCFKRNYAQNCTMIMRHSVNANRPETLNANKS